MAKTPFVVDHIPKGSFLRFCVGILPCFFNLGVCLPASTVDTLRLSVSTSYTLALKVDSVGFARAVNK